MPSPTTAAGPTPRPAAPAPSVRWVAYGLLAVTAVVFLAVSWGRMTAPFGDSDEGINGAVWAYGSRSMRDLGPVTSALGGRHLDGSAYATHPPLIVTEAAVAELVAGERGISSRAPAWIGTLVALGLLYRLGRRLGWSPVVAAGAVAATGTTGMALTYGSMLDTPVTAFPFGVGITVLWVRSWDGDDPPNPWLAAGVALAGALAGWQCAVLAGLGGAALAVRSRREPAAAVRAALPYVAGAVAGVALSVGWSWWTYGDLSALGEKLGRRSGATSTASIGDVIGFQLPWLAELLGLAAIGLVGSIAALWDRRVRPVAALSLITVVGYSFLFREAAAGHQYWCYWALLPTAIGFGWLLSRLERDIRARTSSPLAPVVAVAVVAVVVGAVDVARPSRAATWIDEGHRAVTLLQDGLPPGSSVVPYVGEPERPEPMLVYELGRTGRPLTTSDQVRELAATAPDTLVYVLGSCGGDQAVEAWCRALLTRIDGAAAADLPLPPRLVRAGDLVADLPNGP